MKLACLTKPTTMYKSLCQKLSKVLRPAKQRSVCKYKTSTTINDLVDDCLWLVFSELHFKEKVGVVRVCRRWHRVIREVIAETEESLEFCFNDSLAKTESHPLHPIHIVNTDVALFNSFSFDNVKEVSILNLGFEERDGICLELPHLQWLFAMLPRLESLRFKSVKISFKNDGIENNFLKAMARPLKKLALSNVNDDWNNLLSSLLHCEDSKLESLQLKTSYWTWIPKSPARSLKNFKLKILNCENYFIALNAIKEFLSNNPQLKRFDLQMYLKEEQVFINTLLCQEFSKLEAIQLNFNHSPDFGLPESICFKQHQDSPFLKLPLLHKLALTDFVTNYEIFESLLKSIPLITDLTLSDFYVDCKCDEEEIPFNYYCMSCPEEFIKKISLLPKLKKLRLTNKETIYAFWCFPALCDLLKDGQVPELTVLKYSFGTGTSDELYNLFCQRALKDPSKSFAITKPGDLPILPFETPRNLFFL